MQDKLYDITLDSDGWSCRSQGTLLGTFPSWLLAVGAMRAAVERDRRDGLSPTVRYQDLRGTMHALDLESDDSEPPPLRRIHEQGVDRLAAGQRPN